MDANDLHAEAWQGVSNGFEADRLAHAYVLVGSPRGNALQFAESILKLLFCESVEKPCNECSACKRVETHKHADTLWLEPLSKSRQIKADEVRALVLRMTQTSFEGGWKAGIILAADCMNTNSANVLLKTLEEPPPKTILLLITDSPQSLLPTIISRCQKIVLSDGLADVQNSVWYIPLMKVLRELPPASGLDAARLAGSMKKLFDVVKSGISDAVEDDLDYADEALDESKLKVILEARVGSRLKEVQADVFRVMLDWHRDVLMLASGIDAEQLIFFDERDVLKEQAKLHTQGSALRAIQVVEGMSTRLERNIPDLQIFDEAIRKLVR